jgi:exosortase
MYPITRFRTVTNGDVVVEFGQIREGLRAELNPVAHAASFSAGRQRFNKPRIEIGLNNHAESDLGGITRLTGAQVFKTGVVCDWKVLIGFPDQCYAGGSYMTPVLIGSPPSRSATPIPWTTVAWVSALLLVCYASVLFRLAQGWFDNPDMGHGFFVPVIAAYIAWRTWPVVSAKPAKPNWWGLAIVIWAAVQLYLATLGAELFLARTSFVVSLIGIVLLLGGVEYLKAFSFPLFLLFFMVPIPAVIYNALTFPLQLRASEAAEWAISFLGIPIIREGNVLELASQKLNVVEACSGIRSLLTLTFVALVYGYFAEKRVWIRVALFFATIPIAIIANAGRVTLTGVLSEVNPELAEGAIHEAQGMVIFLVAIVILVALHQGLTRTANFIERRKLAHIG